MNGERKLGRHLIDKAGCQLAASFPIDLVAKQALEALVCAPDWPELKSLILSQRMQPEVFWAEIDLPLIPTLGEVRHQARARLAQSPSLEEVAISAWQRLLERVYSQLIEAAASSSSDQDNGRL